MNNANADDKKNSSELISFDSSISRRRLLQWTTPVVAAISLPAHAVTSSGACTGPPILNVPAAPKCAGDPPVGTAIIEILAPIGCPMMIKSISVTSNDPKSSVGSFPDFPAEITDQNPESVVWTGPASDAVTCLPLANISITIEYCCDDGISLEETYDITELLTNSIS